MPDDADAVDRILAEWKAVYPDLDGNAVHAVGRVIVLAERLRTSVEAAFRDAGFFFSKKQSLSLGQFDILATLRRHGGRMTPGQLLKNIVLTSGGLTSRLDRMEDLGLIKREDDPADRRGVLVLLTAKGKKLIDAATRTRFEEAKQSLPPLSASELKTLTSLLRRWLASRE